MQPNTKHKIFLFNETKLTKHELHTEILIYYNFIMPFILWVCVSLFWHWPNPCYSLIELLELGRTHHNSGFQAF